MQTGKKKINVLFVLPQLSAGGTERVVLDLARNLDGSSFSVYTAFFAAGALKGAFSEVCREIFHIPKKGGFDLQAMLKLSRIIHDNNIDVVNAHHFMPFVYSYPGSRIINRKALIYTEHSVAEVENIDGRYKWLCSALLLNTYAVVGVSMGIAEAFRKRYPCHFRKVVSIPNGVDVKRFATHVNGDGARAEWGLLPEHFIIGTVGNFRNVKNHACLVRAFHRLSIAYPQVRLVLVGRGFRNDEENSEEVVKRLIESLDLQDRVILTGYREDIPSLLKSFDVFCLPSFSEGLPVSILEAMAAGTPVSGSDVKGIREVISHNGTGLLFPSNDDGVLAGALEELMKDRALRESLSKAAFEFVSHTHGIGRWVCRYQQLFQGPFLSEDARKAVLMPDGPEL